ncbi:hypothetical protein AB1Y20_008201 [Prymnesium parvum]|uniref:Derlin n=1 Tax=Prymnesium parvum TaxID=97485 RepID=A0AB34IU16_PRYPA|mmetsp:Transcript_14182/g.35382  ORF Transcript_14182/g.35382 Transcript_14182/m.35382 type:complete len:274 (+) Transcript_14182:20-841(+)
MASALLLPLLLPSAAFLAQPRVRQLGHLCSTPLSIARAPPRSQPSLSLADLRERESRGEIVAGVGEGRELPSLSGINTLPLPLQAAVVIAIALAIGGLTALLYGPVFDAVRGSWVWSLSRPTWPILGAIYLAAGVAHFTEAEGFENITPPNGTWGFWYTPFSPRFNVYWTGVVEIFGGAWMMLGFGAQLLGVSLPAALGPVVSDAALTLFLLTIVVTPANIFAMSHNAKFPLDIETPVVGHVVRLLFQPVLLAMLLEMAQPTLLDAKVNLGLM